MKLNHGYMQKNGKKLGRSGRENEEISKAKKKYWQANVATNSSTGYLPDGGRKGYLFFLYRSL
jgi:hypothetical protein